LGSEVDSTESRQYCEAWKSIVNVSLTSFELGIQLANKPQTDLGDVLDDVSAAKATSTMHARADALIRYISWAKTNGHVPIPFSETVGYACVNDVGSRSSPTFPRSFYCVLEFVGHVAPDVTRRKGCSFRNRPLR
jgi:hypothetical protein